MENKTFTHNLNLSSTTNQSSNTAPAITTTPNSLIFSPLLNTTATTPTLQTLQPIPETQSSRINSDHNTIQKSSNRLITQPTFTVKEEQSEDNPVQEEYPIIRNRLTTNQSKRNPIFQPAVVNSVNLNSREPIHGLSAISMSMANIGGHLMSTLNPPHLPDGNGSYFISGLPSDLPSNYKLPRSSNSDLPSPSTSSNSSNPSSSNHHQHHRHQGKRHGGEGDPTRKRAVRLQKNRDAARECRRKKKEYIKCLEERVTGLETQNKALIEELRQLKELYCQREETNNNNNNSNNKTTTNTR